MKLEADNLEKVKKSKDGGEKPFSILIPVYNEEDILESSVKAIFSKIPKTKSRFELLICENGSTDGTVAIAEKLKKEIKFFNYFCLGEPNYGKALQKGIENAKYDRIIVFEIDFYSMEFLSESLNLLDKFDLVVGSKRAPGAIDKRPLIRRFITWGFNASLKILLGFKGTDTHGLKAFRRDKLLPIALSCKVFNNLFSTEFVIRAQRAGLKIKELPAVIAELRGTRVGVLHRIPEALVNLAQLFWVIRFKK
jgi:glycosyltransferase involved in cell wall biosynthesis